MLTEAKNIIGGEYKAGGTGKVKERYNPGTGELVGRFTESTSEDVDDAIRSARRAFELTLAQGPEAPSPSIKRDTRCHY